MRATLFHGFSKKFFISYLALLLGFLALLFPFVSISVQKIVYNSMISRQNELIARLAAARDDDELVDIIKEQRHYTFFRMAVLDSDGRPLYDSHTKRLMRPLFFPFQFTPHPEVEEALKTGQGYAEGFSEILKQKLIYVAKSFNFHGKTYVLRLAFPHSYIEELRRSFEIGFILISSLVLLLFGLMAAILLHLFTKPIRKILEAIKPYKEGEGLPKIELETNPHDDFGRLAATLNSLSDQIRTQLSMHYKIIEMRKEFIANASHELKTPITIIRGFAETLQDNPTLPTETTVEITQKIVSSCERMTKTIRNLLTLADIEHLPLSRIGPVDLLELIRSSQKTLLAVYTTAELFIFCDEERDYTIEGDEALLEVALMNLLDNAAKYGRDEPKINIRLERQDAAIKISIQDNGIGIPESDLERIFQRFYRVNKMHTKKVGGSGLGLSIVETIIEKHAGRIAVESTVGVGTTFTLAFTQQSLGGVAR